MDDTAQALQLMKAAPALRDALQAFVDCEDAFTRGDITFAERCTIREKALAEARSVLRASNQETSHV